MKAIFLGHVAFRFARAAARNRTSSSSSLTSGSTVGAATFSCDCFLLFLLLGSWFLGLPMLKKLVLILSRFGLSRMMRVGVVVLFWMITVVEVVVVVNTMAKGKHKSIAQKRESGLGDSIASFENIC